MTTIMLFLQSILSLIKETGVVEGNNTRIWPNLGVYPKGENCTCWGGESSSRITTRCFSWWGESSVIHELSVFFCAQPELCELQFRCMFSLGWLEPGRRFCRVQAQVFKGGWIWVLRYYLHGPAVLRNTGRYSPTACCSPGPAPPTQLPWQKGGEPCIPPSPLEKTLPCICQGLRPSRCPCVVVE